MNRLGKASCILVGKSFQYSVRNCRQQGAVTTAFHSGESHHLAYKLHLEAINLVCMCLSFPIVSFLQDLEEKNPFKTFHPKTDDKDKLHKTTPKLVN